jgi:hypothetical protein
MSSSRSIGQSSDLDIGIVKELEAWTKNEMLFELTADEKLVKTAIPQSTTRNKVQSTDKPVKGVSDYSPVFDRVSKIWLFVFELVLCLLEAHVSQEGLIRPFFSANAPA